MEQHLAVGLGSLVCRTAVHTLHLVDGLADQHAHGLADPLLGTLRDEFLGHPGDPREPLATTSTSSLCSYVAASVPSSSE
ncbi:hypothetical protein SHIRM173S_10155 [Streptomyces hirsutus]